MIKISLKALLQILTSRSYTFSIERCPFFLDKTVYIFPVSASYPTEPSPYVYGGSHDDRAQAQAHRAVANYKILCYYDASTDEVISASHEIYDIIRGVIKQAKTKIPQEETDAVTM
jgi:hypothetical protein